MCITSYFMCACCSTFASWCVHVRLSSDCYHSAFGNLWLLQITWYQSRNDISVASIQGTAHLDSSALYAGSRSNEGNDPSRFDNNTSYNGNRNQHQNRYGGAKTAGQNSEDMSKLFCSHCNIKGHTKEMCYRLNGYPPNHKNNMRNSGQGNMNITAILLIMPSLSLMLQVILLLLRVKLHNMKVVSSHSIILKWIKKSMPS